MEKRIAREVNHFILTNTKSQKSYRFSYDRVYTVEEKMNWRKQWLKGMITLRCGCGKVFGINKRGAIYYPASEEKQEHAGHCRKAKEKTSMLQIPVESFCLLPPIPRHPKDILVESCEEAHVIERWIAYYGRNRSSFKGFLQKKMATSGEKNLPVTNILVERRKDLQAKKPEEDVLFFIRPVKSIQEERYGFKKVILLDVENQDVSVWIKSSCFSHMSGAQTLTSEKDKSTPKPSQPLWFVGMGYLREEKWNNRILRKLYILRGAIL